MQTLVVIVIWMMVVAAIGLISGLIWWLALGVMAHMFNNPNLAISYWQSVIVAVFANMILGGVFARWRKKD